MIDNLKNMFKKEKDNRSEIILKTFKNFGIKMKLKEVKPSPIFSYFIFDLITPTRMKDLDGFVRDLNYALAVSNVRIDAPIPDTSLIGIEVPNKERIFVDIKEMWNDQEFLGNKEKLLIPFGRMVGNKDLFVDLVELPHLLVSGSTDSGKSNFLHCMISSLIKKFSSEEVKFILVDNKRVEFTVYNGVPHLLTDPISETNKTINALSWLIYEMEKRYKLLQNAEVMNIAEYNKKGEEKLPYILFIEDEFADDVYASKEEFEEKIIRILQMGRAVGLHIILSTSRPSEEIVGSMIGANITTRLCFALCCASDSKEVLFQAGAEKLLSEGDALFLDNGSVKPIRLQTPYISEAELKESIENIKEHYFIRQKDDSEMDDFFEFGDKEIEDELYEEAKKIVIESRQASASFIQRKLKIGYARSARLLDMLEERGIVSEADGANPRKVLKNKKILFIEDDEFITDLYEKKFSEAGFEIEVINKPDANFINKVINFNPDLIITGLLFPNNIDGFQLTKAIRSNEKTKDIVIIGFDNWTEKEEIEKLIKLGMNKYIRHKETTPTDFLNYIKNL